jgi:acetyl esterase/lipase
MAPQLFLLVSAIGLVLSASSWWRGKHLFYLNPLYFLGAWLTGELALHHLAWQAGATLLFGWAGAFESWHGLLGLALTFVSWGLLIAGHARALDSRQTIAEVAREAGLEVDDDVAPMPALQPFRMRRPGVEWLRNIPYGEALPGDKGGRNLLDVVRPSAPGEGRPILLQVHGGGWTIGDKREQAQPLMAHLAQRGWVSFAINYRLSPKATFPDHIVDVKRAIAWIREHAEEYGADPNAIYITGGSAGGHLSALAALTPNDPRFQPGFEEADTRIAGCVPFYGVYDFLDRAGVRGSQSMEPFLARAVFKSTPDQDRELWEASSPIARVSGEAPPFLVIHGSHDSLVFVEEAHEFVRVLKEKSQSRVHYLELAGAQHAFDIFHSVRSDQVVRVVTAFLERIHGEARGAA